jgi:hypothetical protein
MEYFKSKKKEKSLLDSACGVKMVNIFSFLLFITMQLTQLALTALCLTFATAAPLPTAGHADSRLDSASALPAKGTFFAFV